MSTLATLLETLKSFESAPVCDAPKDPRLRQRNICPNCGACPQDLIDANQREVKQKNINNGLQRLLDLERIDHDKLKREHQDLQNRLERRDAEIVAMRKRVQTIISEVAQAHADFDMEPPSKKTKR